MAAHTSSDVDEIRKKRAVVAGKRRRGRSSISPAKARKILHDKKVHGKPLTDKQRKFFGARSNE